MKNYRKSFLTLIPGVRRSPIRREQDAVALLRLLPRSGGPPLHLVQHPIRLFQVEASEARGFGQGILNVLLYH
jgi:hypothetical protein